MIAERAGARVFYHPFTTSAGQRQWALDNIDFHNDFLFVLDADEWVTIALATELRDLLACPDPDLAAAWVKSRYVYEGRWIPRSTLYPSWTMRLFRVGRVHYEDRVVNAHPVTDGVELRLSQDLVHEDRKSLAVRVLKIDRYARLEALATDAASKKLIPALRRATTWRRRAKLLHSVSPFRAATKAALLLLRGGLFEGKSGLHFVEESFLQERLTTRYLAELRRQPLNPDA